MVIEFVYKLREAQKRLSFPRVKRVGNPSLKLSERFRTSRNDRQTAIMEDFVADTI